MPFPDAERAIVAEEKICEYLLNAAHPIGGSKAVWFESLGYSVENWRLLADDLRRVAAGCEQFVAKASPFGVKFETVGEISIPPHRPGRVLAVWIVEGNSLPRLITAYPA